ncbi:hypothetical protein KMZ68_03700 [Bradyrhizobium sediminis]|uniref:Uncharacterized protein n=1 Tax=Bradyrhizobium sediminis TaxID=2840469 RepID=A0A975NPR0_9BRAD|nr:hypothetical protein [Bradyrhizobium sediminis]QWG18997.1 hypothetical protein KMZ68_03700 [Bradyrhizobium sediminis]
MAGTAPNKFKLSVAGALHPAAENGPKLEQVNKSLLAATASHVRLPLTAVKGAGFYRARLGGMARWHMMRM